MLGTIVNAAAILVGGAIGLLLRNGLPDRISDAVMNGVALTVLYVGISGSLEGQKTLVAILSIVVGGAIGTWLNIDKGLNKLGDFAQKKLSGKQEGNTFAEGFINASLVFCVGAMAVVGSLQSGLTGNHEVLFAKALLDGISSAVYAAALGSGVLLSAIPVLLYQGAITLLAGLLSPVLSEDIVSEMTCVGSLLIIGIGLNMLKVTKLKLANYLPAIFLPILFCRFF